MTARLLGAAIAAVLLFILSASTWGAGVACTCVVSVAAVAAGVVLMFRTGRADR
ncbi:hypothetical protein [Curtobacterium sp. MCBD17_040]|uniref:hypothetical protein n=1 Tax=Curtobacterium sp. MCBD17_040 TaxID=2175674 RepID=UPI0015E8A921|nr:hypothetical protein [Curtobacterium sp. MCBD17_040]WIB65403.1 hypothetical protein DEI94_18525 [Curtobacterium sp. MCBD17_040]